MATEAVWFELVLTWEKYGDATVQAFKFDTIDEATAEAWSRTRRSDPEVRIFRCTRERVG